MELAILVGKLSRINHDYRMFEAQAARALCYS